MKTFKNAHGLTLIEIIAAVGILAVGLIAILSLFPVGLDSARNASNLTTATLLSQSLIERLHMAAVQTPKGTISYPNDIKNDGINWYNFGTTGKKPFPDDDRFEYETNFVDNYNGISNFHQVTVYVYWPPGGIRQQVRTFITYIWAI